MFNTVQAFVGFRAEMLRLVDTTNGVGTTRTWVSKNESDIPNAHGACFGFTKGACTSFGNPPALLIKWADQVTPGLGPYQGYHQGVSGY